MWIFDIWWLSSSFDKCGDYDVVEQPHHPPCFHQGACGDLSPVCNSVPWSWVSQLSCINRLSSSSGPIHNCRLHHLPVLTQSYLGVSEMFFSSILLYQNYLSYVLNWKIYFITIITLYTTYTKLNGIFFADGWIYI